MRLINIIILLIPMLDRCFVQTTFTKPKGGKGAWILLKFMRTPNSAWVERGPIGWWLKPKNWAHVFVCDRDGEIGHTCACPASCANPWTCLRADSCSSAVSMFCHARPLSHQSPVLGYITLLYSQPSCLVHLQGKNNWLYSSDTIRQLALWQVTLIL